MQLDLQVLPVVDADGEIVAPGLNAVVCDHTLSQEGLPGPRSPSQAETVPEAVPVARRHRGNPGAGLEDPAVAALAAFTRLVLHERAEIDRRLARVERTDRLGPGSQALTADRDSLDEIIKLITPPAVKEARRPVPENIPASRMQSVCNPASESPCL